MSEPTESPQYVAAAVEANVTVRAYRPLADGARMDRYSARREVNLGFNETFANDAELDEALERFTASVKAAARNA